MPQEPSGNNAFGLLVAVVVVLLVVSCAVVTIAYVVIQWLRIYG